MNQATECLISVIIPCFKQAHFLRDCIASLQAQTYPHWEAFIVNDGSPDDTGAVAESLSANDARVRYVEKKNGGLSSARNAGLKVARGEYIQFLDADDLLEPTKFEIDLSALKHLGQDAIAISDYLFLDGAGTLYSNRYSNPRFLRQEDPELELAVRWESDLSIPVHCMLVSSALLHRNQLQFSERLANHEDWEFWMRVFKVAPKVALTKRIGAIYRRSSGSMSANRDAMYAGFVSAIHLRYEDPKTRPLVKRALRAKLALTAHQYGLGWRARLQRVTNHDVYRRWIPWPVQRTVGSVTLVDMEKHITSLHARFLCPSSDGTPL